MKLQKFSTEKLTGEKEEDKNSLKTLHASVIWIAIGTGIPMYCGNGRGKASGKGKGDSTGHGYGKKRHKNKINSIKFYEVKHGSVTNTANTEETEHQPKV